MNFIEVCAGAGGLSTGFIKEGFTPLLLNDKDKVCCETLRLNHPYAKVVQSSMTELDLSPYQGELDLLMGGVPCQSWSLAGKGGGYKDKRGDLLLEFARLVEQLMPRVFLIENVKGLLYHNKGESFNRLLELLNSSGNYDIYHRVLNSAKYSVPQKRERVFIIGVQKSLCKSFEFPAEHSERVVLRDVLTDCPSSEGIEYSEEKRGIMEQVPQGGCWVDLDVETQKAYMGKSWYSGGGRRGVAKRLHMDEECLTLLCSPSQKQTERCHPIETRPLNIAEYARIQTFDDSYKFSGSTMTKYKQIGNAVPVSLGQSLAKQIKKLLKTDDVLAHPVVKDG